MRMMLLEEDEKKKKKNKYTATLLLCLLSCLVLVEVMPLLNGGSNSISRGFRDAPPSTYALNLGSYSKLVSTGTETYESDVFQSGGCYNWTLTLYPSGNTRDNGADHISLYLRLDKPSSLPQGWEVHTKISFFVQIKPRNKYLVVEEREVQRLDAAKTEWGIGKLMQLSTLLNEKNGYLVGDKCQFGAEVIVLKPYHNSERLSFLDKPENGNFTWKMLHFSRLEEYKFVYSDEFAVAGSNWKVRVAPRGDGDGWRNYLSIYLELSTQSLRVNEKVYAKASIRVLNTNPSNNIQRQLGKWYSREVPSLGFQRFMSLVDLHDHSRGYLVGDRITIQIHFHLVSTT
ncbi:hypothetical protein EUTSA_v10008117mg [Eutrema salsugineum]|uniref:MATH domain-containing protein n=1 Tax=Eutrema salsugineum TaxID=72664 RepID=V4KZP4_EUTSA|nr:uncharacterized protein LOC18994743 [Eutrema salsugineum]ESQ36849.1 hypothetical protein EUTSA_v10008117mg [Eutrema salsugineum]